MGSRVAVIAPPSLEAGGLRRQAGTGCGGACPAGRVAGASRVDVGRAATRSTAERLLRTPLVVRSACRLLVVERRMKGLSPALDGSRTRLGPTAEISGGARPTRSSASQSRISNGPTAMFQATPQAVR